MSPPLPPIGHRPSERVLLQIRKAFEHQPMSEEQRANTEALRIGFRNLAMLVAQLAPESREQALALTKLEEALMHAVSAVARHGG